MNDLEISAWHQTQTAERLIKALESRGFTAMYAPLAQTAKDLVLKEVAPGSQVAITGSQTLEQIGVCDYLRAHQNEYDLLDPSAATHLSPADNMALRRKMLTCDTLLTGTNALDTHGCLYNLDGLGNRVAAMIFGPLKVVVAVGLNKLVAGPVEARQRMRDVAGPMNVKRLNIPNPCAETGRCHDCRLPTRICNAFTVLEYSRTPGRIKVILIGGQYGY